LPYSSEEEVGNRVDSNEVCPECNPCSAACCLDSDLLPAPKGKQRIFIEVAEIPRLIVTTFPFQRIVQ
jgi:hypothetical protein